MWVKKNGNGITSFESRNYVMKSLNTNKKKYRNKNYQLTTPARLQKL